MNIKEYERPSKRRNSIKPGEGRLTGILQYGILLDVISNLKLIATKFDLDLRLEHVGGFFVRTLSYEFEGEADNIRKAAKGLELLKEMYRDI